MASTSIDLSLLRTVTYIVLTEIVPSPPKSEFSDEHLSMIVLSNMCFDTPVSLPAPPPPFLVLSAYSM